MCGKMTTTMPGRYPSLRSPTLVPSSTGTYIHTGPNLATQNSFSIQAVTKQQHERDVTARVHKGMVHGYQGAGRNALARSRGLT